MPQSLSRILVHIIFSTKHRQRLIDPAVQPELWPYLAATSNALGCHAIRVGGVSDHVHLLCQLPRTKTVSELLEEVKVSSSKWMKTKGVPEFAWQNGYGCFSIGQSQVDNVVRYIDCQEQHHQRRTFQEDYLAILKKYGIPFDERYVWE